MCGRIELGTFKIIGDTLEGGDYEPGVVYLFRELAHGPETKPVQDNDRDQQYERSNKSIEGPASHYK